MNILSKLCLFKIFCGAIFIINCTAPNRKVTLKPDAITERLIIGEWVKDNDFFRDIQELQKVNTDFYNQQIINKEIYETYETVVKYKELANTLAAGSWRISISDTKFVQTDQITSKTIKQFPYTTIEKSKGNYIAVKGEHFELFSLINPDYILHYSVSSCGALYFPYKRLEYKEYAGP